MIRTETASLIVARVEGFGGDRAGVGEVAERL